MCIYISDYICVCVHVNFKSYVSLYYILIFIFFLLAYLLILFVHLFSNWFIYGIYLRSGMSIVAQSGADTIKPVCNQKVLEEVQVHVQVTASIACRTKRVNLRYAFVVRLTGSWWCLRNAIECSHSAAKVPKNKRRKTNTMIRHVSKMDLRTKAIEFSHDLK